MIKMEHPEPDPSREQILWMGVIELALRDMLGKGWCDKHRSRDDNRRDAAMFLFSNLRNYSSWRYQVFVNAGLDPQATMEALWNSKYGEIYRDMQQVGFI